MAMSSQQQTTTDPPITPDNDPTAQPTQTGAAPPGVAMGSVERHAVFDELKKLVGGRGCYTMADAIHHSTVDPLEIEDVVARSVATSLDNWNNHPLLTSYMKQRHTAQHDTISGIQELSMKALQARRPKAIGRMLVNLMETTRPSLQFPIEEAGEATQTSNGGVTTHSYSMRHSWTTVNCDIEVESSDKWNLNFLEDAEWNVAAKNASAVAANVMERETKIILNKLKDIPSADSAGQTTLAANTNLTADHLIDAYAELENINAEPDCVVVGPKRHAQLLKDDDFKDSTLLGEFVNYRNGMFGQFLGMQMYKSTLVPTDHVYVFDKMRVLVMALRRDRLMVPLSEAPHKYGIQISSRFGLEYGDKKSFYSYRP